MGDDLLSREQWQCIFRACSALRLDYGTPPYLKDFLSRRLSPGNPALAAKIQQFSDQQMDVVCREIRQHQAEHPPLPGEEELQENGNSGHSGK